MEVMMGGACSTQRHERRNSSRRSNRNGCFGSGGSTTSRSQSPQRQCSRHAVVSAVPDDFISNLYPLADNYVLEGNGMRSPKSLSELCTDALCRSLPYLDGALPPGLPQDIVDDITHSLVKHSALNATTLRVLRNCELESLMLAGCRGVTDEWLEPLSSSVSTACATPPLVPSPPLCPVADPVDGYVAMETMNLGEDCNEHHSQSSEVFYNAKVCGSPLDDNQEDFASSCSTSSFVSASSTPYEATASPPSTTYQTLENERDFHGNNQPTSSTQVCKNSCDDSDEKMQYKYSPQSGISDYFGSCMTSNIKLLDLRGSQRLTDKGLLQLSGLSSLEIAKLDNCHSIQGRGLMALENSHHLHTLSLANCRRLTDEAIINISHLTTLEALSLDGCRCLTDRSMVAIGSLNRIKKLDLSQCDLITDSGLKELEHLDNIEELSLGWCRSITDCGIEVLASQHGRSETLRILSLARVPITDSGVHYVGKLSQLEELDLNGCTHLTSEVLGDVLRELTKLTSLDISYCNHTILRSSWQGKINSLKRLDLCYSGVKDIHLGRLTSLPALEEISLDSCPIGDWSISHFADNNVVPNLISLDLADTDLSDLGMIKLAKFKKLKCLSLFYCNIANSSLRHLSLLSELEVLNLDSRHIGDEGLMHLRSLRNLKSLDIFSGKVTDYGCIHLSKIKSLEALELCGGGITDTGCATLATSLENLVSLNLSQNERITNRGAAALATLSKLKALNLSNTRVNSGALIYLSELRSLKSLALYGCRGIEGANNRMLDRLQCGLPNLKCVRRNNGSDEDGIIEVRSVDTDDEDFDSDTDEVTYSRQIITQHDDSSDDEDDSDSEMQDAQEEFGSDTNDDDDDEFHSESSFSDHDM